MKKSVFLIMIGITILFNGVYANAGYKDISRRPEYVRTVINYLSEKKIVQGDGSGYFYPEKEISRAEFVKILVLTLGYLNPDEYQNRDSTFTFKDVPNSHWGKKYILAAFNAGLIKGTSANTFAPGEKITREQIAAIMFRALVPAYDERYYTSYKNVNQLKDRGQIAEYFKKGVEIMMVTGLMKGTSADTFNPKAHATREQVAVVMHRFLSNRDKVSNDLFWYLYNLKPEEGKYITLGSSEEDVYSVMRIPRSEWIHISIDIRIGSKEEEGLLFNVGSGLYVYSLNYGGSSVYISQGKVVGWSNGGELKANTGSPVPGRKFTIGSTRNEVFQAMGTPTDILVDGNNDSIYYDEGFIRLVDNKVVGWSEYEFNRFYKDTRLSNEGKLKIDTGVACTGKEFTLGSTRNGVFQAMGTPKEILVEGNKDYIYYDEGFVKLIDNKVVGWSESEKGGLLVVYGLKDPSAAGFTYGSAIDHVKAAMGTPDGYSLTDKGSALRYGKSYVYLNGKMEVSDWNNKGELNIGTMQKDENAAPISLESDRGDVARAMGEPDSIIKNQYDDEIGMNGEYWIYGDSKVYFFSDGQVGGWNNKGVLKLQTVESQSRIQVGIGTAREDIMEAYGTPDLVSSKNIKYGDSIIKFGNDLKAIEIINTNKKFRISGSDEATNQEFAPGASMESIFESMGNPDLLKLELNRIVIGYGSSTLAFYDNRLVAYDNSDCNLRVNLGERQAGKYITIFSTLEEVIAAMGTPDKYSDYTYTSNGSNRQLHLFYGESEIDLDNELKVTYWRNESDNLILAPSTVDGPVITEGTSADDVLSIMGAPDQLTFYYENTNFHYMFWYGKSYILLRNNDSGVLSVTRWVNNGDLKVQQ